MRRSWMVVVAGVLAAGLIAQRAQAQDADAAVQSDHAPALSTVQNPEPVVGLQVAQVVQEAQESEEFAASQDATTGTGPTMASETLGPRLQLASSDENSSTAAAKPSKQTGLILMIAGGAALITGLIIGHTGGDIAAVIGGLAAAYGVYVFVGSPTEGPAHHQSVGVGVRMPVGN
ncbi:MAG TPA: hypothetical protein VEI06_07660 [Gemmatimonadaceae bacterium]|nr:hypothetical protein [Gemmatimonadaceae bacterium]